MTGMDPSADPADPLGRWQQLTREFALGSSSMPLHARISALLAGLIENGDLAPGDQLPAERQIAELLGVSIAPVRQAILEVAGRGLLERRRGRGTFVRGPALDEKISILHSFTESMRDQHAEVETHVLRQERVPVPADAGRALGPGERNAILVERVAILSREPVALLQAYLSPRAFPGLLTEPLANQSLYETLRSRYGTVVTRAESVIELARASSAEADKLGIPAGEPLLKVEGTAFADSGAAVEYFRVLYRGDRVRFHLDSHRESDRVVRLVSSQDTGQRAAGRGARAVRGGVAGDSGPRQSSAGAS
jgi:GntR family transcriptional regulator